METLRILIVNWRDIQHPKAGGSELYVQKLGSEFVKIGHEVHLYSSRFPRGKEKVEVEGVKILRCGGKLSVYWAVYRQYIKEKKKYDVVLESINTIPFFMPLYAMQPVVALIYSINNRRVLMKELGITPVSLVAWLSNYTIPSVYGKATVITISESARREIIAVGFDASQVFVANPGVGADFDRLIESVPEPPRPNFRIVYIGRLKKYKGLDVILQAVSILKHELPIELLIVGKGDYKGELCRRVNEMGLTNIVRFTGFVTKAEKVAILKNSSVFVCCSIDEGGWTIAGLEALKCGVPLVLTNSQRDLVQEGVTGFITQPQPEVVADRIRTVLEGNWKSMSTAARESSRRYTWKSAAKVALKALNSAINRHSLD